VTKGYVYSTYYYGTRSDGWEFENQLLIMTDEHGTSIFSEQGDSGSAVLGSDGKMVGLLWGGDDPSTDPPYVAGATPIAKVVNALNITIATSNATAVPYDEDRDMRSVLSRLVLRDLERTDRGRRLVARALHGTAELRMLVDGNRRVATVWHRNHGPEILSSFVRLAQERSFSMPEQFGGEPLDRRLDCILGALLKVASDDLRRDLVTSVPDVFEAAGLTYAEWLSRFERQDSHLSPTLAKSA
jgi:hypothetical protein